KVSVTSARSPTTSRSAEPGSQSRSREPTVAPRDASISHPGNASRREARLSGSTSNAIAFGRFTIATPRKAGPAWGGPNRAWAPPEPTRSPHGVPGAVFTRLALISSSDGRAVVADLTNGPHAQEREGGQHGIQVHTGTKKVSRSAHSMSARSEEGFWG